ncbi:MAG: AAA family ATPase [Flavobacteriales bacterium]|nr:AAA family ATPase [Flavobacteriales bacterium]
MSAPNVALNDLAERMMRTMAFEPTAGQRKAISAMERLLGSRTNAATLVLRGYAGTGKTTLVGALVKSLMDVKWPVVLLAPTGRAAKVLAAHAQLGASTIHRRIYRMAGDDGEGWGMMVAPNRDRGALFIVDEASMIGRSVGEGAFGDRDLLSDLLEHIFSSDHNKLLLIGDPAQLPPVGSELSPALNVSDLRAMGANAGMIELTEVVRHAEDSGILSNATALRSLLAPPADPAEVEHSYQPTFSAFPDVHRVDGHDLQDILETAYAQDGDDEVCVICRSNKRAYQYNQQVRMRIHGYEEELSPGDRLMVVKNNYLWAGLNGDQELIANGEPITVKRVHGSEERYGFRFADITVNWWNGRVDRELDVKVILDTLASESPALPGPRMKELAQRVAEEITATKRSERIKLLRSDPYANALQVKYAYAVTAHKAQGGQWLTVFVDQGYVTEEMIDREYVRWLYTSITRATQRLYLLNFHARFWGEE